jgi:hypothetical protein
MGVRKRVMTKKKYFLIIILIFIIMVGIYVKIKFPYLTVEFLKNSLFPPASVVDAKTQATAVIYTEKLTINEILTMINGSAWDRVVVISTVNPDGSPHAGVLEIKAIEGKIEMEGLSERMTCKNVERNQEAVITVYKRPVKGSKWFQNIGARLWVKLIDQEDVKRLSKRYLMEIIAFRAI